MEKEKLEKVSIICKNFKIEKLKAGDECVTGVIPVKLLQNIKDHKNFINKLKEYAESIKEDTDVNSREAKIYIR